MPPALSRWLAKTERFWDLVLGRRPQPRRSVRLGVVQCEARDQVGNLVNGLFAVAFGGPMTEPLQAMAAAVGDLALLGRAPADVGPAPAAPPTTIGARTTARGEPVPGPAARPSPSSREGVTQNTTPAADESAGRRGEDDLGFGVWPGSVRVSGGGEAEPPTRNRSAVDGGEAGGPVTDWLAAASAALAAPVLDEPTDGWPSWLGVGLPAGQNSFGPVGSAVAGVGVDPSEFPGGAAGDPASAGAYQFGADPTGMFALTGGPSGATPPPGRLPQLAKVSTLDLVASEVKGGTSGLFEFRREGVPAGELVVTFKVESGKGMATPGIDYVLQSGGKPVPVVNGAVGGYWAQYGQVTIPYLQRSAAVKVQAIDDGEVEGTETVKVTVVQVAGVDVPAGKQTTGLVSITDNDPLTTGATDQLVWVGRVDQTAQENYESYDQWNQGMVELRRSNPVGVLNVNYVVTGTATFNSDYSLFTDYYTKLTSTTGAVTFGSGQDRIWVRVAPILDSPESVSETAEFTVLGGSGYTVGAPDKGAVGIHDDRPPASSTQPNPNGDYTHNPLMDVYIETVDATASEAGADGGSFRVSYKHWSENAGFVPPDPPVPMYILGGTAKEGEDYTATTTRESVDVYTEYTNPDTGLIVYSVTSVYRIDITPIDDAEWEGGEDVDVAVPRVNVEGAIFGIAKATLADNEATETPVVRVEALDPEAHERDASTGGYRIVRDGTKLGSPLTVGYQFEGSASYGIDYQIASLAQSGSVTFAAGQKAVEVKLTPLADALAEGDETATLALVAGAGYAIDSKAAKDDVVIHNHVPEPGGVNAQTPDCFCGCVPADRLLVDVVDMAGTPASSFLGAPANKAQTLVRYSDGALAYATLDLRSSGFGGDWGLSRSWTNLPAHIGPGDFGRGWSDAFQPFLQFASDKSVVTAVSNGLTARPFIRDAATGLYEPQFTVRGTSWRTSRGPMSTSSPPRPGARSASPATGPAGPRRSAAGSSA